LSKAGKAGNLFPRYRFEREGVAAVAAVIQ
jgi:hypothetical protein